MAWWCAERDPGWPAGYSGVAVAESLARTRSSWLRELMASLAKTLPRWSGRMRSEAAAPPLAAWPREQLSPSTGGSPRRKVAPEPWLVTALVTETGGE